MISYISLNATCIKTSKQRTLNRKWPKDSLTKALLYSSIQELPQECCHRSSTKLCDTKGTLKCFSAIYFRYTSRTAGLYPAPGPHQIFLQLISAAAEAGGKGAARSGRPEELPGAGINRTRREEPNGGSNRKAHIPNTSLEAIKQQHSQINANQNQPQAITSARKGWFCPSLDPWQHPATAPDTNTPSPATGALKTAALEEGTANLPQQIVYLVWVIAQVTRHSA